MYLKPDRSSYQPSFAKSDDDPHLDIGWNEGFVTGGRPYRVEAWCEDQITALSFFFPAAGIENFSNTDFADLLEKEGLVRYLGSGYRSAFAVPLADASSNNIWSVNVVIGDGDGIVTEASVSLLPYAQAALSSSTDDAHLTAMFTDSDIPREWVDR